MVHFFKRNFLKPKFSLTAFILLFISPNALGQIYESIEKEAANVLLSKNNPKEKIDLEKLKKILFSDIDKTDLEKTYNLSSKDLDSLRNNFTMFESESENISIDSAMFLFNQWCLHLSNTFYEYQKEKFF